MRWFSATCVTFVLAVSSASLATGGTEAESALTTALTDPDELIRITAALTLINMGADAKTVSPVLNEALQHDDARIRYTGIGAV